MKQPTVQQTLPCLILLMTTALDGLAAEIYSHPATRDYPTSVYWGDTHLHTNLSVDANGMGNRKLSPDEAYRFARGEAIRGHNGQEAKLSRPLDFLVVTDHAVNMGVMPRMQARDPLLLESEIGKKWREIWDEYGWSTGEVLNGDSDEDWREAARKIGAGSGDPRSFFWRAWSTDYVADEKFRGSVWDDVCANAERYNDPGNFTAFIGYEWTPSTQDPKSPNFHRNMIFKGGKDLACQVLPFSIQDSRNVEDLWAYLADYETSTGDEIMAIPHNGNLSSGKMFAPVDFEGRPIDVDYVRTRHRWEPLYEMTQYKGDSETHPVLSPNDEFADFETWQGPLWSEDELPENWAELKGYEYARSALKLGLNHKAEFGINPFKFGMIGATDAHTGLTTADEDNFWSKRSLDEPSPYRARGSARYASQGYAAVWARENTRTSLFAAMKRREVYASTGPRIRVRFFGGWDFEDADAMNPDLARQGYDRGVPMGGDLTAAPAGEAPRFLIRAVKDPEGANLDRVQVIKGWRDDDGRLHEKVYNVALADGRSVDDNGKAPPVGNTVDVDKATYTNSIGDPEFAAVWRDPDFDPDELAFYYVRVIQIPTPRWTTYDAAFFGLKDLPDDRPKVIQERAYTSPIWYTPE